MEPLLMPVDQASKALGVGRTTMYELIGQGDIPTVKIGRRRLVPAAALREYVDRISDLSPVA